MNVGKSDSDATAPIVFAPDWGASGWKLWKLVAAAQAGELQHTVEEMLCEALQSTNRTELTVSYSLSLLSDVLRAGGQAWVRDSRLYVSWPAWNGAEGRKSARSAMSAAREMRALTREEVQRIRPLFAPDLDGEALSVVMREADFVLRSVAESHPSGANYQEAFGAALRHWSMPYRGRSGRMKRFVLTATHRYLGAHPVVAGLLELGDEAPFCSWRDDLLGLSGKAFVRWLQGQPMSVRTNISERLRNIRACVRPTSLGFDISSASAADIVLRQVEVERTAHGRSLVLEQQHELLKDRKRIAHALRLARGEFALANLGVKADIPPDDPNLFAGVRAIHDLVLPSTHLEATVCGAVPPFSEAMGGKLVVSFFSHPNVVSSTLGAESELLRWSFDFDRFSALIPSHGMLCVTTKGLYANHAAIYTRSEMPGLNAPLRLRHLANTDGTTTTLISDRSARIARALLESPGEEQTRVSSVYGSGGAKRHRAIEAATVRVGLSPRIAFAGIRRPVYGARFVANAEAVCWLGESPNWLVRRNDDPTAFCQRAVELWRSRWLEKATQRVQDYAVVPSLARMLESGLSIEEPTSEAVE